MRAKAKVKKAVTVTAAAPEPTPTPANWLGGQLEQIVEEAKTTMQIAEADLGCGNIKFSQYSSRVQAAIASAAMQVAGLGDSE